MAEHNGSRVIRRRHFLVGAALTSVGAILAACGGGQATPAPTVAAPAATTGAAPAPTAATTGGAPTAATTGSAPAPTTAAAVPRGQSKGELRVSLADDFPTALDGVRSGYEVIFTGMAETLTRITPEGKLMPWLAESVTNSDASTWRVTLRKNAKFWDGSPVTADAVAAAFKTNWEKQPAADGLVSKDTQVTIVDPITLEFKTPQPTGTFANAISAQQFVVHKDGGTTMTGPYRGTKFETDRTMTLEAFADHWAGAPPIAKITVTKLTDQNARALALQSGDLDMVYGVPPEIVKNFGNGFESWSVPSRQVDILQPLSFTKPPFDDPKVRQALALAIDRASLLKVALDNQGAVATGMFPPNAGVDVVALQSTDVNRAKQLLDEAGWQAGGDGIRSKSGTRLSASLISYPARGEITPMAVAIQGQLKAVGFDIQVQEVQDSTGARKSGTYALTMNSMNTLVTGDPVYLFAAMLAKGGRANYGNYTNPQIDTLLAQMRAEPDPTKRGALSKQAQEILRTEAPVIYLAVAPIITAAKKGKVVGYAPNPNNQYFIDNTFGVA